MPDASAQPGEAMTLVVHAGALGDSILLWPLLRALVRRGDRVVFAANPSHSRLAAEELGVTPLDIDRLGFLWKPTLPSPIHNPNRHPHPHLPSLSPTTILDFLTDPLTPIGRNWLTSAQQHFPSATIHSIGPPASPSRRALWQSVQAETLGAAAPRTNPGGPVVLFVGAGSRAKRWPLDRWLALADLLRSRAWSPIADVYLLAGHVEHEQFTPEERYRFAAAGGRFVLNDLPALATAIRAARLYIGADSGPTHLAAQLGVPTLALFGPTDPEVWGPVGPRVRVVAPPRRAADMGWLEPSIAWPELELLPQAGA